MTIYRCLLVHSIYMHEFCMYLKNIHAKYSLFFWTRSNVGWDCLFMCYLPRLKSVHLSGLRRHSKPKKNNHLVLFLVSNPKTETKTKIQFFFGFKTKLPEIFGFKTKNHIKIPKFLVIKKSKTGFNFQKIRKKHFFRFHL